MATIAETMARLSRLESIACTKLLIDLHAIEREAAQVAERRLAGAEVARAMRTPISRRPANVAIVRS